MSSLTPNLNSLVLSEFHSIAEDCKDSQWYSNFKLSLSPGKEHVLTVYYYDEDNDKDIIETYGTSDLWQNQELQFVGYNESLDYYTYIDYKYVTISELVDIMVEILSDMNKEECEYFSTLLEDYNYSVSKYKKHIQTLAQDMNNNVDALYKEYLNIIDIFIIMQMSIPEKHFKKYLLV